jgi:hypothetical protein
MQVIDRGQMKMDETELVYGRLVWIIKQRQRRRFVLGLRVLLNVNLNLGYHRPSRFQFQPVVKDDPGEPLANTTQPAAQLSYSPTDAKMGPDAVGKHQQMTMVSPCWRSKISIQNSSRSLHHITMCNIWLELMYFTVETCISSHLTPS